MPTIKFRGKEYDSLAEMPATVRHDYFKSRAGYDVSEGPKGKAETMPSGLKDIPDEVREIYQRAREEMAEKPVQSSPADELPRIEDLYRRSAPETMQDGPSDEVIYRPSPPLIQESMPSIVEPDRFPLGRLVFGLAVVILLLGIALFIFFGG